MLEVLCQKQLSRAGRSNYIPHHMFAGYDYLSPPLLPASGTTLLILKLDCIICNKLKCMMFKPNNILISMVNFTSHSIKHYKDEQMHCFYLIDYAGSTALPDIQPTDGKKHILHFPLITHGTGLTLKRVVTCHTFCMLYSICSTATKR